MKPNRQKSYPHQFYLPSVIFIEIHHFTSDEGQEIIFNNEKNAEFTTTRYFYVNKLKKNNRQS